MGRQSAFSTMAVSSEGALAFGDRVGRETFAQVLNGLHDHYGEALYRVTPWLKQRLQLELPLSDGE